MTRKLKYTVAATAMGSALLMAGTAQAANSWGLPEEEIVRFEANVVDILCELTGDCPNNCGDGSRQLGLLTDDGILVLPIKNSTPFSGSADELIDFCGKRVLADGLYSTNRGYKVFALQFVKELPDGKWRAANRFKTKWAKENGVDPKSQTAGQWFRNDPRVIELLSKKGKLGLGPEADKAYIESQQ